MMEITPISIFMNLQCSYQFQVQYTTIRPEQSGTIRIETKAANNLSLYIRI